MRKRSFVPRTLRGESGVELPRLVEPPELGVAADGRPVDQDLGHRPATGELLQVAAERGIVVEGDLLVRDALVVEQGLRADAVAAPPRGVDLNSAHCGLQRGRRANRSRRTVALDSE